MRQTETENADVGLVAVSDSDAFAQAYALYDEVAVNLSEKDQAAIEEIFSLAEENYERDPKQWDKLLGRLLAVLKDLSLDDSGKDGYDEEDEDEQTTRSIQGKLSSILEEAEALWWE